MNLLPLAFIIVISCLSVMRADFIGRLCNSDWVRNDLWIPPTKMAVDKCLKYCANRTEVSQAGVTNATKYAGVMSGSICACSDTLGNSTICYGSPSDPVNPCSTTCTMQTAVPCTLDPTQVCGGSNWYGIYDSSPDTVKMIKSCHTKFSEVCSASGNNTCTWFCNVTDIDCYTIDARVQGTGTYTADSSVCASAVHDLRYNFGEVSLITFTRKIVSPPVTVEGSWRYEVTSKWATNNDLVNFTSPEQWNFPTSDIFAVYDSLSDLGQCVQTPVGYQLFRSPLNGSHIFDTMNTSLPFSKVSLTTFCGLENVTSNLHVPTSYVPLVLPTNDSKIVAQKLTTTVKIGDNATISFRIMGPIGNSGYGISKQGHSYANSLMMNTNDSIISLSFNSIKIEDTGFYVAHYIENGENHTAVTRLIVMNYNLSARCENHGQPRQNGTCLCPHPFKGPTCNETCPTGSIGPACSTNCSTSDCQGTVMCQQDPIGCHCASGWWGHNCSEPCPADKFGPDCMYSGCHCINQTSCDRYTGYCTGGQCAPGWFGSGCNMLGPSLGRKPTALNPSYNGAIIEWPSWSNVTDKGDVGPPDFYILEMQTDNTGPWMEINNQSASANVNRYRYLCYRLTVNVPYKFRVVTGYKGFLMTPSPVLPFTPVCPQPTQAPNITNYTLLDDGKMWLQWGNLAPNAWNCSAVNITVNFICTQPTCNGRTLSDVAVFMGVNQTNATINTLAYADCNIYLAVQTNPLAPPLNSNVLTPPRTMPGKPKPIQNFKLFQTGNQLLAIWQPPSDSNGILKAYYVRVSKSTGNRKRRDTSSDGTIKLPPNATSYTFTPSNQKEAQVYMVTIYAGNSGQNGTVMSGEKAYNPPPEAPDKSEIDQYRNFWITIIILAIVIGILVVGLIIVGIQGYRKRNSDRKIVDYHRKHHRRNSSETYSRGPSAPTEARYVPNPVYRPYTTEAVSREPQLRYEPADEVKL